LYTPVQVAVRESRNMHPRMTNMHAAACDASEHIFASARALACVNEDSGAAAVPALYNAFAERQHAYFIPPLLQTLGGDRCSDYCTRHLLPALKKITTTLTAPLRACVRLGVVHWAGSGTAFASVVCACWASLALAEERWTRAQV